MNSLKEYLEEKNYESLEHRKFKTIAEGRNFIEKTRDYTSDLKDKTKKYMGRGSKAGFVCLNNIYNQFLDLSKNDGKWSNQFVGDRFIETWKDPNRRDEIEAWMDGKKGMIVRLFVKDHEVNSYIGKGIYYYSGHSENGVLWSKHK